VLDAAQTPTMSVGANAGAPVGAVGTVVSSLADTVGGSGLDNVADPDHTIFGIAITGANSAAGTWYWSADDGAHWNVIAAASVSETNALLLNPEYRVYFRPAANTSGVVSDALTFHAWDHSSGTQGSYADTSVNGGSTAYSTATDTISVTVVNQPAVEADAAYVIYGGETLGGQSGLTITGTAGNDTLTGKDGGDILTGGGGADILTGGLGADIFTYTATSQGGDTIKDFTNGDDLIGILNSILGESGTGTLDFDGTFGGGSAILFEQVAGASTAAQHDSAKLIFDTSGHNLYFDNDGGASGSGRILIAHLENAAMLEATSIQLHAG
jgi:Ca2+-binding RTX toxin-like protein